MSEVIWQGRVTLCFERNDTAEKVPSAKLLRDYRLTAGGLSVFTVEELFVDSMGADSWRECIDDSVCVLVFAHALQVLLSAQVSAPPIHHVPGLCQRARDTAEPANVSTFPSSQHGPLF